MRELATPKRPARTDAPTRLAKILSTLLFVSLAFSIAYAAVRLASAPIESSDPAIRARSDYVLMLLQCGGGLIVMFLPTVVNRTLSITLPTGMQIAYFVFLYAAIYLGEVRNFYVRIPFWDTILHFFSGAMLGALGFYLVRLLNDSERPRITLSPAFVSFFAFCFALASGAVWEIYEFTIDGLFGTNMQRFALEGGEQLVGRAALADTMEDLIVDALAALSVTAIGYLALRHRLITSTPAAAESQPG